MTMLIRRAGKTDETAVIALWRSCGLLVEHNDPAADFRFARGRESSDVLLGIGPEGRVIASAMVGHDGHRGWLYYVAVDPARRGQGLGRQIVEAAETWLSERSVRKVQLLVRETNTDVIGFYAQIGFETAPVTIMQKWLRTPSN